MSMRILKSDLPLPELLQEDGIIKLLPAASYDEIPSENLALWCHKNARYGLVTVELIDWLRSFIGIKKAIEIGSGSGDLAYHLGVRGTDNWNQEWPDVRAYYQLVRQPTISYPQWVRRLDGVAAVQKFQPEVVIASWVTEWIDPSKPMPEHGGSMYGVKENLILDESVTYVLIGNEAVHGHKKIMAIPHETYSFPWLWSRASRPDLNRIWVWDPTAAGLPAARARP